MFFRKGLGLIFFLTLLYAMNIYAQDSKVEDDRSGYSAKTYKRKDYSIDKLRIPWYQKIGNTLQKNAMARDQKRQIRQREKEQRAMVRQEEKTAQQASKAYQKSLTVRPLFRLASLSILMRFIPTPQDYQ